MKKNIKKYTKLTEKIITKKIKYKAPIINIYGGKANNTYKIKIKKKLIGMRLGELIFTKKTGNTIHNTEKKKKKKK